MIVTQMLSTDSPTFSQLWGLGAGVMVLYSDQFTGSNTFSGLGSGGDSVNLYNNSGTLISTVSFAAATAGKSFQFSTAGTSLGVSSSGVNSAFTAPGFGANAGGDVGSPGVVPEPASLALLSLAGVTTLARRRRA
jgi:hypothetical protein